MTEKKSKTSAIAKALKKGLRSLLSGKKDLDKVATTLAVTAVVAEEVQAAQKPKLDAASLDQAKLKSRIESKDKREVDSSSDDSSSSAQDTSNLGNKTKQDSLKQSETTNSVEDKAVSVKSNATDAVQQAAHEARMSLRSLLQDELANTQAIAKAYPITPDAARMAMRNVIDDEVNYNVARASTDASTQTAKVEIPELKPITSSFSLASLAPGLLLGGIGGGGGGASSIVSALTASQTGIVADGYIYNAKVYRDDGTGQPLNGVVVYTNKLGAFDLSALPSGSGRIVAEGGIDTSTGLAFSVKLYAPVGSTVINPLTTMVQSYVEKMGLTPSAAAAVVSKIGRAHV